MFRFYQLVRQCETPFDIVFLYTIDFMTGMPDFLLFYKRSCNGYVRSFRVYKRSSIENRKKPASHLKRRLLTFSSYFKKIKYKIKITNKPYIIG
jgi:hypothetical protein